MLLRTIWELEEEGIEPRRARLAERLRQATPTVSQTVQRMERKSLVRIEDDGRLRLTSHGRRIAVTVMRRHRLAERFLTDVIGLDWALAHTEACRWEHVMSHAVEVKLVALLGNPALSPYGNPIPPDLSHDVVHRTSGGATDAVPDLATLDKVARPGAILLVIKIGEGLQSDVDTLSVLAVTGIRPGTEIEATASRTTAEAVSIRVRASGSRIEIPLKAARSIFVRFSA